MTQADKAVAAHRAIRAQMIRCEAILEDYTKAMGDVAELADRCPSLLRQALDLVRACRAQADVLQPIPPSQRGEEAQRLMAIMRRRIRVLGFCLRATEQRIIEELQVWGGSDG